MTQCDLRNIANQNLLGCYLHINFDQSRNTENYDSYLDISYTNYHIFIPYILSIYKYIKALVVRTLILASVTGF